MEKHKKKQNNQVCISGEIISNPIFSHTVGKDDYYELKIHCKRASEIYDNIPVIVPTRLMEKLKKIVGEKIKIEGEFRSFSKKKGNGRKLKLYVLAKEIMEANEDNNEDKDEIKLRGFICKPPVYRKTPLGKEITDLMVAVNRTYWRTDYIPTICWGRNARFSQNLPIGSEVEITGRIQSRLYIKKYDDGTEEEIEVNEVSIYLINNDNREKYEKIS